MKWETAKTYPHKQFKRLAGIKRETFEAMTTVLRDYFSKHRKHPKKGAKPKPCLEDKLWMMLMYYREYRTFFHTASAFGISESQCWRIVVKFEDILIKSGLFRVDGKKALLDNEVKWEVILVDVSESAVERPKKNSGTITQVKRKNIQ